MQEIARKVDGNGGVEQRIIMMVTTNNFNNRYCGFTAMRLQPAFKGILLSNGINSRLYGTWQQAAIPITQSEEQRVSFLIDIRLTAGFAKTLADSEVHTTTGWLEETAGQLNNILGRATTQRTETMKKHFP